ncbi:hypothetical protein L3X38_005463 [Prunus dulcis]|uniref:Uncharacterized protein n=1 Tax=Prunus dulcis TaxID=3755 RepID=A0AAD4ZR04_PRUDU|nr:hypothetical protein L3X38_005463 [Prunus dulcis]
MRGWVGYYTTLFESADEEESVGRLVVSRTHERDRTRVTSSARPRESEVGWLDYQELTVLSQYQQKPISQSWGPTAMHDPPHYILILLCLHPPLLEQRLRKGTLLQWGPALSKLCFQTHHGIIATLHAYLYIRPYGPHPLPMVPDERDCLFQKWNGIYEIVSTVWFGRKYLELMWPVQRLSPRGITCQLWTCALLVGLLKPLKDVKQRPKL